MNEILLYTYFFIALVAWFGIYIFFKSPPKNDVDAPLITSGFMGMCWIFLIAILIIALIVKFFTEVVFKKRST